MNKPLAYTDCHAPTDSFNLRLPRRWRSNRLTWAIKRFLKRAVGREVWVRRTVSLPVTNVADWQYNGLVLGDNAIVYSLGVGDNIDFDRHLIEKHGAAVHAFDPTPFAVNWLDAQETPAEFHFHQWAVAALDGELCMQPTRSQAKKAAVMWTAVNAVESSDAIRVPALSLATIMAKLGHRRVNLLKMDIEGLEYEVIESIGRLAHKPDQLLVEFHHRFEKIGTNATKVALAQLKDMGYEVLAVSRTGREVSFIKTNAVPLEPIVDSDF